MTLIIYYQSRMARVLWILLTLFVLRVAGQLLVALGLQGPLPPMEEWYSGLMSYRWLLPSQILIIMLCVKICIDFTRRRGCFFVPRAGFGRGLLIFGCVYFLGMVIRYILRMTYHPEARWFGGTLPIFFHWVLAMFVLLVGRHHFVEGRRMMDADRGRGGGS